MINSDFVSKEQPELYEVIEKVQKTKNRKDKISLLRQYNYSWFSDYLRCLFDDRIQFQLPGGKPPFTKCEEHNHPSSWRRENVKLKYFVAGLKTAEDLTAIKRESIFIGIIESVHPKDAELIVDMINKTPPKTITKKLVQEAFPNMF